MNIENASSNQSVKHLQTMLRTIALCDNRYPLIAPSGYYDPETAAAVASFQRDHNLPSTGSTDPETLSQISEQFEEVLTAVNPPEPVHIIWNANGNVQRTTEHPCIPFCQCMLFKIHQSYHCISAPDHDGILNETTSVSIKEFQSLCGLPATGSLDKRTWKYLALHYPLSVIFETT